MTDSMKFGPEWLRNMSADNTNTSLLSSGGTAGGGTVMTTSSISNNSGNGSGHQSFGITSSVSAPAITPFSYALAPRNTFPEFRYGREEMLSLFDKNYNMPEILPTFKRIFVEKVQLPLALTPSTDEELSPQVPPVTTQRPAWMQRSPVGFNTSTRGVGRGSSVDRGRMRGKPNYHQIYQRPTAMFGEDDPRSIAIKAERGWPERNGGGDSLSTGGGTMCGIGLNSDWNGTPNSSPRKEFSSHPRNMENWRRNRTEDGSGDAPSSGLGSTEGWRGNSGTGGNFTTTHRWGRSTSWRDEDMASANMTDIGYSGSGHSLPMQRSYSTITTVNERGGYISSSSKAPPNSSNGNQASSRTFNFLSGLNTPLTRSSQWHSHSGGIGGSSGGDVEDNLPEWAMENPLDGGGTFDASGAFHGSVDDDENIDKQCRKKSDCSSESSARNNEGSSVRDSKSSDTSTGRTTASLENEHNKSTLSDSSELSPSCTPVEGLLELPKEKSVESKSEEITQNPDTTKHVLPQIQQEQSTDFCSRNVTPPTVTSSNSSFYNTDNAANKINTPTDGNGNVHRDLSDRMREVTDNMIEKLIMEDDTIGMADNNVQNEIKQDAPSLPVQVTVAPPAPAINNLCAPNVFTTVATMLKQPSHQPNEGPVSVSPTLAPVLTDGIHKGIQLYGGGLVVDHATMQHHHMQQQQLAAVAAANITSVGRPSQGINSTTLTTGPTDLWYYRDPQSKVQGPFTAIEMTEWYRAGYFNDNLFVRRICDTHFRSLGELIKICNDNMPFTHSHLIPNLDNIHLSNSPAIGQTQKHPATGDFTLKQQTHQQAERQQQQQRDQLKNNMNPAVEFLGGNVKNLIPVDMYFQMLRHQEMLIYSELSDNECFQQLTPSEKEGMVRQKLQMYVEYLPNRPCLGNSLAAMNHSGTTNQLYDILDGAKKDHIFNSSASTGYPNVPQQQPPNSFLEHDDFLLNTQQHQQPIQTVFNNSPFGNVMPAGVDANSSGTLNRVNVSEDQAGNELINNFNMRMFLPTNNGDQPILPNPKPQEFIGAPNADFLNEAQLLVSRNSLAQNNSLANSWLPPVVNRAPIVSHQSPNEWPNNLLVGIPMTVASGCNTNSANDNNLAQEIHQQTEQHPQKIIPVSMWDLPSLEHIPNEQIKSQQQVECEPTNYENHKSSNMLATPTKQDHAYVNDGQSKGSATTTEKLADAPKEAQQQSSPTVAIATPPVTKELKDCQTVGKHPNDITKRAVKQQITTKISKGSEDASNKKNEEDRRRDHAEDKRRQKEEKKRLQAEEEKRRQQQIDEEKRRQMLEEKERQQQIQAQRRKAMLGNNANINNTSGIAESASISTKLTKENQRIQSSVAPWSAQSNAASSKGGPCLAEIQKAERRERQMEQRQMEMFVKRVRASAAAAVEAFDSMLKWNAPVKDVPVKSFAEIQAEEAKRLANEQIEMQRRKEQEQQQVTTGMSATSNATGGPNNISAIWSGTKVWGSTSTTGFWEEPIKFSAAVAANNNSSGGSVAGSSSANNIVSKTTSIGQQKLSPTVSAGNATTTASGPVANQHPNAAVRNLRKSQTVSIMQGAGTQNGKSAKNNQQPSSNAGKPGVANKTQPQKGSGNNVDGGTGADKKVTAKNQSNNGANRASTSTNKREDYESEFIVWCTKSLNNMNTKLDVPTFVTFLRDLESPYEVRDYIRMYLGENKESADFGKQFLERRSKYKNLQRAQNAHNDDMCKPAPAITPSGNDNYDNKGKQKKVKKNKMTKLDARILGFSVTAAEGRTNVGDRVYVDAP